MEMVVYTNVHTQKSISYVQLIHTRRAIKLNVPTRGTIQNTEAQWHDMHTSRSGNPNSTFLSILPGLIRAGSRVSGLGVQRSGGGLRCNALDLCVYIPVGCHEHFDVTTWVKPVQLVDQLKHSPLYLI